MAARRGTTTTPVRKKETPQPARPATTVGAPHGTWRDGASVPQRTAGASVATHLPAIQVRLERKEVPARAVRLGPLGWRAFAPRHDPCCLVRLGALRRRRRDNAAQAPAPHSRRRQSSAERRLTAAQPQQRSTRTRVGARRRQPQPRSALRVRQRRRSRQRERRHAAPSKQQRHGSHPGARSESGVGVSFTYVVRRVLSLQLVPLEAGLLAVTWRRTTTRRARHVAASTRTRRVRATAAACCVCAKPGAWRKRARRDDGSIHQRTKHRGSAHAAGSPRGECSRGATVLSGRRAGACCEPWRAGACSQPARRAGCSCAVGAAGPARQAGGG